jgi:arginyl-tRNA synthetase
VTDLKTRLDVLLSRACKAALGDEVGDVDPQVRPAKDARFGDYQANLAMSLAKRLGKKPRDLAQAIAQRAESLGELSKVEVAGPGFINVTLADSWLC